MLEVRTVPGTNLVELLVDGEVTKEGFNRTIAHMEAEIARHGSIRLLEEVRSLGKFPPSKVWDDLKFAYDHLKHIERCAVVGDSAWLEGWTKLAKPFISCPVRYFSMDQMVEARTWLAAEQPAEV